MPKQPKREWSPSSLNNINFYNEHLPKIESILAELAALYEEHKYTTDPAGNNNGEYIFRWRVIPPPTEPKEHFDQFPNSYTLHPLIRLPQDSRCLKINFLGYRYKPGECSLYGVWPRSLDNHEFRGEVGAATKPNPHFNIRRPAKTLAKDLLNRFILDYSVQYFEQVEKAIQLNQRYTARMALIKEVRQRLNLLPSEPTVNDSRIYVTGSPQPVKQIDLFTDCSGSMRLDFADGDELIKILELLATGYPTPPFKGKRTRRS